MSRVPKLKTRGDETVFFDALDADRIVFQRCDTCHAVIWYLRSVCPHCMGPSLSIVESAGLGEVHSFTTLSRAGHPARVEDVPYSVVLVDLDEGFRIIGDFSPVAETDIIGCRVRASIEHEEAGARLVFSPADER